MLYELAIKFCSFSENDNPAIPPTSISYEIALTVPTLYELVILPHVHPAIPPACAYFILFIPFFAYEYIFALL